MAKTEKVLTTATCGVICDSCAEEIVRGGTEHDDAIRAEIAAAIAAPIYVDGICDYCETVA